MRIFVARETSPAEKRVAIVPATVTRLVKLGAQVTIEVGLGKNIHFPDAAYTAAGATVTAERAAGLADADIVLRLGKPSLDEIGNLKPDTILVSHLDPFNEPELLQQLAKANISAIAMEMIPRSTIAQKMDALSSQANLAGYVAVILGAERMQWIFPMMTTPSGTIRPAKVFIIGVGVAGLQAIATAKRLGASVEAFDTRPVVEEQVKSLGAKFVKVDLGETGQTAQGYARELTPEQLTKQREAMAAACAQADLVITTAQVFGRRAPQIVTTAIVERMKPGSIIVDLAIDSGGNVECARLNEEVTVGEVTVLGYGNLAGRVPRTASNMYSNNLGNLLEHFWDRETKSFKLDPANEILKDCLVTHQGAIGPERLRQLIESSNAAA
ncbi:MAG TPA: Re/Si-specific NAD(P)(+) transhydrogenase subunit alpha [Candidatus Methylacidiphilales bacterium]|nr:Re/Si-specific NAD(P)(+) transhydrogenase subunit alpha [Candidatus Methylacidiphilales bacterium]